MGRHRLPPELRPVRMCIRVAPDIADVIYHVATRQRESQYMLLGRVLARVFAPYKTRVARESCYRADEPPSTLGGLLIGSSKR